MQGFVTNGWPLAEPVHAQQPVQASLHSLNNSLSCTCTFVLAAGGIEAKESIESKRKLNTLDNLIVELKKVLKL